MADFEIKYWTGELREDELAAAFRKKWEWVVDSPSSSATRYLTIIGNLEKRYLSSTSVKVDAVRDALLAGLSRSAFERLKLITNTSNEELAKAVRIPTRTLARRKTFKPEESDRILRIASAFQLAIEVLGDLEKARRWFIQPKSAFGEKSPLQFCDTGPGAEQVEDILGRIEHGVFS